MKIEKTGVDIDELQRMLKAIAPRLERDDKESEIDYI